MTTHSTRPPYSPDIAATLETRLQEPRRYVYVVSGPRQVVKTTLVHQVLSRSGSPNRFVSADEPTPKDAAWLRAQWEAARLVSGDARVSGGCTSGECPSTGECDVFCWRDRNREVDFVVRIKRRLLAIEVKSDRTRTSLRLLAAFEKASRPDRTLIVGRDGIRLDDFLSRPESYWLAVDHSG
ncbi:MAG: hypothetical protein BMS9Abin05_2649 [Rhodothermia bacterium]|nr:MAG: hypothetical protein BMS9Abin05_2649 [Rhodothermia bacterium]